jgi:carboxyl-terminal processing protease
MTRKRKFALLGALLIVPVVAGGFAWQVREQRAGVELLQQVLQLVNVKYVDTLPLSDVYEKAARGLVKELNDPYSELYTPKEYNNFNTKTGGR